MSVRVLGVVWYRFRVTFGRRRGGYLAVVLLVGLAGGVAMGAVAAARRTQASFAAYLASTSPSDLTVLTGSYDPGPGYDPGLVAKISRLPHVKRVESYAGLDVAVLAPSGAVRFNVMGFPGSIDGEYFGQDRVTIVQGRMANPRRADEVVIDAKHSPAQVHVGSVIPVGFYTNAQERLPDFGKASIRPYLRLSVRVVGKAVFSRELVQDDVDAGLDGGLLFTPALTRQLTRCCVSFTETAVRLDDGARDVAAAEAGIERVLPRGFPVVFYVASLTEAKAERALRPESIALGVFGGIAALATLLIAGQVIGRQLRLGAGDLEVLRALGAGPAVTVSDQLPGLLTAVGAGSLLAAAVAAGLSPLAPIGLVRPVYPDPGIAFDWTVLGLGVLVLIAVLSAVAVALAYRQAPHRATVRRPRPGPRGPGAARAAASSGLPAPAVEGIRFALDPGTGRNTVPARSAILGAALATIVVVATVTFGASLDNLVSHPALYGWNWTYALSRGYPDYIPQQRAAALLDHDPGVAAWTGVYFGTLKIDGQTVPVIGASPHAPVGPPVLSGHSLDAPGQIVLGAATLAQLHKHLGDTVEAQTRAAKPARLRIVGTATLPSLGIDGTLHTEMGTGALLSYQLIPGDAGNPSRNPSAGPNNILVRLRPGANPTAVRRTLRQLVPGNGSVSSVQRPAEIVNYRSMGTAPALLGAALAAGAVTALGLTLIASVRRRRRDLALLKTLGFTRRQLAAAVAWQSSITVAAGTIIGVPLGIALGRFLWDQFAQQINVVPQPTVPAMPVILITFGALALANIVAALPGRLAARTPTALLLRAE